MIDNKQSRRREKSTAQNSVKRSKRNTQFKKITTTIKQPCGITCVAKVFLVNAIVWMLDADKNAYMHFRKLYTHFHPFNGVTSRTTKL